MILMVVRARGLSFWSRGHREVECLHRFRTGVYATPERGHSRCRKLRYAYTSPYVRFFQNHLLVAYTYSHVRALFYQLV